MNNIARGGVYLVHFGQVEGLEQGGKRPAVIISADLYNQGASELVIVIPFTTRETGIPSDVKIVPPDGGLDRVSYLRCDHVRTISRNRLLVRIGEISDESMLQVEDWLRILLALE